MATINCPHCGKEMFEMLDTCPHCGGPVVSEALEKAIDKDIAEICARENKGEKLWFILSTVVGVFLGGAMGISTIGAAIGTKDFLGSFVAGIGFIVIGSFVYSGMVYGCHSFHPIRRFSNMFGLAIGLVLSLMIGLMVGFLGGLFFWYPRAVYRLIKHEPLLTEDEVVNLAQKDLISV